MTTQQFRIEKDSLGEVQVPADALYGVQTVRATQNFPITQLRTHPVMIRSLGMIKKACAMANHECGHLDDERTGYILTACDEIIQGKLDCWFITDEKRGE